MSIINQLFATGILNYVCAILGLLYTLPSSTVKLFTSENTPLNRVMTETEIALMGSISCGSTLITTPICGYLLDSLGRKKTTIILFIVQVMAWVLLVSLNRVESFICAMFLCGLSGSIFLIVPVYINEFCEPSIRGTLSSSALLFHGIGTLISYGLGGTVDYATLNYTGLSLAVLGLFLLSFLRESPLYLMKKGLENEAIKSIGYYLRLDPDCKEVAAYGENLKRLLANDEEISDIPEIERLRSDAEVAGAPTKNVSIFKFLRESPSSRRAFTVLVVLYTATVFQGFVVVQIFTEPLFATAVPSISSTLTSIIFGITVVLSFFLEAYLIETAGRRMLLIVCSALTGILCVVLGTQIQFHWGPGWLTAVFIYIYTVTFSVGPAVVPYVLMGEIFLPQIKSFASTFVYEWAYFCSFVLLFLFNPLLNAFGLGPIFYIFAGFCFFTAAFTFFFLPETKNLPVNVIQEKFLKGKMY
ncbi:facilitated trehalose transporter Tret1-2 homolog [Danaus plexippus]|uniref:facilitated trehalose transporter Tret1-2 homolog n=1 Tax=Danaus plexippus TaxID=13037 RepID=UPI002AAFCC55|nr:facilitated trehalose transporter Tret1-2 homolog [Danaus plexippus]